MMYLSRSEIRERGEADVTKGMWDDYRRVQASGEMNMMGHWYAPEIIPRYDDLLWWFETEGNTGVFNSENLEEVLVLNGKKARRIQLRKELAELDAELGEEE